MRWAQTGSYGTAPNPAMPNVFVAQGYDLGDPWSNDTCYGKEKCNDFDIDFDQVSRISRLRHCITHAARPGLFRAEF